METQDKPVSETVEAGAAETWKPPRWLKVLAVVVFSGMFVINLLRGYWVAAIFVVATVLFFLLRVDAWPKPRRYLAVAVYFALAVAMMVELIWQLKVLF